MWRRPVLLGTHKDVVLSFRLTERVSPQPFCCASFGLSPIPPKRLCRLGDEAGDPADRNRRESYSFGINRDQRARGTAAAQRPDRCRSALENWSLLRKLLQAATLTVFNRAAAKFLRDLTMAAATTPTRQAATFTPFTCAYRWRRPCSPFSRNKPRRRRAGQPWGSGWPDASAVAFFVRRPPYSEISPWRAGVSPREGTHGVFYWQPLP